MNIKKITHILLASILSVSCLFDMPEQVSAEETTEIIETGDPEVSESAEEETPAQDETETEEVSSEESVLEDLYLDHGGNTDTEEVIMEDETMEFNAGDLNADLGVGETETVTAEVRAVTGDSYYVKNNVRYTWEYDSDAVEITNSAGEVIGSDGCIGGTEVFNITRIQTWETSLTLTAEWTDVSGSQESASKTYTLNELYYDIWLESTGTNIFSDGDFSYTVHTENIAGESGEDYSLILTAGGYTEDGREILFTQDQEYSFIGNTITFDGTKVFSEGIKSVFLSVTAERNGYQLCYTESDCEVVEAQVDYQYETDQKMLPGWTGVVKEAWQGTAYNAAHPEKEIFTYYVTDVNVISNNPAETDKTVASIVPDSEHEGWVYTAENTGEATVQVTYNDIYGESKNYTFLIQVLEDVYTASVKSDNGSYQALPGNTVKVTADVKHQSEEDTSLDGLTYEWNIKTGSDWASVSADESDPAKAVISFRELKEDENYVKSDVTAEVVVYKDGEEQCRGEVTIKLSSVYYELLPAEADSELLPGNTSDMTAEVRRFAVGEEYAAQDDVHYRWEYDDTSMEILDESGIVVGNYDSQGNYNDSPDSTGSTKTFTIRRLNNESVLFKLIAEWKDDSGNTRKDVKEYKLNSLQYPLSLNHADPAVYDDAVKSFKASADVPPGVSYEIRYEAGLRDETNTWTEKLTEGTEYTLADNEITFDGVKTAAKLSGNEQFDLKAILFINQVQICDAVFTVRLIDACTEHDWEETVIKYPTYDTKGLMKQVCKVCGEERTVEIPKLEKIKPTSFKFLDDSVEVALGGGIQIAYEILPEDAYDKMIWTSSNENVAVVDQDGIVIAKGYGRAVIQAVSEMNPELSDKLTVIVSGSASGIALDESEINMFIGDSLTLKPTFTPAGKTASVIWTSSDRTVAEVDENGKITATGTGTAEITASIGEGLEAVCKVHVSDKTKPAPAAISFDDSSVEMPTNDTLQLNVKVTPENADDSVTWSSSNEKAAVVDENGKVTAKTYGKTTITAVSKADPSLKATITIQTRFYDVNDSTQSYYKPVYWGADNGVVAGYDSGVYFGPDNVCTRAQFVTFLWRLAGRPDGDKTVNFKDIDPSVNYYRAVKWAVSKGIIVGYKDDNTFRPDNEVTRGQVAVMLWRFAGKNTPALPKTSPFSDIDASSSSYRAVVWGQKAGVIKGYKTGEFTGQFRPDDSCLRQHIVTFLYRYARDVMGKDVSGN